MGGREVRESFGRVEQELQRERAAALARIGRTLEDLIARTAALRDEIAALPSSERSTRLAEYREIRQRACLYRWYLEVQREAVGLRRHELLDHLYPIPPALHADGQPA